MVPLALQVLSEGPDQQTQSANQPHDGTSEAQAPTPNAAPLDSVEQAKAAERRQEARDEADVRAQQGMMIAAAVQALLSLLALWGLYFTVRYARRAWMEAQRGADASFKAARIAEQANADAREFFAAVWVLKFERDGGRDGPPAAERIDVSYFSPPPT